MSEMKRNQRHNRGLTKYDENDPYPAQWLENLADAGLIAAGDVDRRSIADVQPEDLDGVVQFHAFAGLGAWSYALRLAGWPDDLAVWTGSCPCQPFSSAGKKKGTRDERHLWPEWLRLISAVRPPVLFGEQVASKSGKEWLATVQSDLEALGYQFAAADLCAAGAGAPHIRQRLYFGATLANTKLHGWRPNKPGRETEARAADGRAGTTFWADHDWRMCPDGAARPVEPGTLPVAYGPAARVGRLRAYGNTINPQTASWFISAFVLALADNNNKVKP
jgi:DNA (cytosine-5)-methyltransferase 1